MGLNNLPDHIRTQLITESLHDEDRERTYLIQFGSELIALQGELISIMRHHGINHLESYTELNGEPASLVYRDQILRNHINRLSNDESRALVQKLYSISIRHELPPSDLAERFIENMGKPEAMRILFDIALYMDLRVTERIFRHLRKNGLTSVDFLSNIASPFSIFLDTLLHEVTTYESTSFLDETIIFEPDREES